MRGKSIPLAAALAVLSVGAAENPLVEMFGDDVTLVENCETQKLAVAGGLFGKCLDRGGFGRRIVAPSEVFDTAKPGTMLCWLRLKPGTDLAVFKKKEPGFTVFEAQYDGPQHQLLGSKQSDLWWGGGVVNCFHAEAGADGRVRTLGSSAAAPIRDWGVGRWHLFAISWSPERIGVSFDASPWSESILSAPMKPFSGRITWRVPESPKDAPGPAFEMDECALLGCVPDDAELRAYYEAALARAAGKDVKIASSGAKRGLSSLIAFKFAYYPYHDRIRVDVALGSLPDPAAVKSVVLEVRNAKGRRLATKRFSPDAAHRVDAIWEIPDLAEETRRTGNGDYSLVLIPDGLKDAVIEKPFKRDVFAWERNRLGLSGVVPPPFEKVRRDRGSGIGDQEVVKVVLREHIVDKKTGLWKQVTAAGKDLLARPMRFVAATDSCSLIPDPCSLSTSSAWDVDGLMTWRFTLKPGHYEPMSLEIPIRAERAKLMHVCTDGLRFNYAGEVPAGAGRVWDGTKASRQSILGDYVPYVWVGGPLRGIAVFGDNDRGWILDEGSGIRDQGSETKVPCQEIVREADGTVVLRLNLVQRAVDLTEERTIKIGFQATPVKPMRKDWRTWNRGSLVGCCWYWGGYADSHVVCPYDDKPTFFEKMGEARRTGKVDRDFLRAAVSNYPYASWGFEPGGEKERKYREKIAAHFGAGMHVAAESFRKPTSLVFYTNGRGVHYGDPAGQGMTFCDEWNRGAYFNRKFSLQTRAAYELDPCASYRDYAAWWWEKMLSSGACDRLYWDDVYLSACTDLVGTDAYVTESGLTQPSVGIFNMREQVKRGAVLQTELGKDATANWIHMTNTAMAPISAFAGVHYDWEDPHFGNVFQERYSRAYCQACAIGRQMGCCVSVMGYFTAAKKEDLPRLRRCSAGVTLTHELGWYVPETAKKALADFGWREADTKVWNYWDEDVAYPLAVTGLENSSIVFARNGEALAVVSNYEKRRGAFRVTPDCVELGLSADFTAVNAETGARLSVVKGAINVELDDYDFVLIRIR